MPPAHRPATEDTRRDELGDTGGRRVPRVKPVRGQPRRLLGVVSQVALCLESAGREDGGDGMSVGRRQRHWGFGAGIHRCPGSTLARMVLTALVGEWLNRIPEFGFEPGFTPSIVHEEPRSLIRVDALPLRWDTQC